MSNSFRFLLTFLCGFIVGYVISSMPAFESFHVAQLKKVQPYFFQRDHQQGIPNSRESSSAFTSLDIQSETLSETPDHTTEVLTEAEKTENNKNEELNIPLKGAQILYNKVKILCFVLTTPKNIKDRAIYVKKTWGPRCNKILYMSSVYDSQFPAVGLNLTSPEERYKLTEKTMLSLRYVYEHYFDDYDWFLKADDDTYVIVENLRYFLSDKKPSEPVYYGQLFQINKVTAGYYSGGAGYVLSKEALRRFAVTTAKNKNLCHTNWGAEDLEMGDCLSKLGVRTADTRDSLGRTRFHCFNHGAHIHGNYPAWYKQYYKLGSHLWGPGNISTYAISFHYEGGPNMENLDFFLYHLHRYGTVDIEEEINMTPAQLH